MANQMTVIFLDVGQGDGTIISSPLGELMLIDLGSKKNADIAAADAVNAVTAIVIASMRHRKLDKPLLDYLFITHGDLDHYNQIITLNDNIREVTGYNLEVGQVAIGGSIEDYNQDLRDSLLTPASNASRLQVFEDNKHSEISNGKIEPMWKMDGGNAEFALLSANYPHRNHGQKNPKSLVIRLQYVTQWQRVILTGDAEKLTEKAILDHYKNDLGQLKSLALKLGHHGSVNGTSDAWLKAVEQLLSFASADMKWAHPYCETIARIVETIGPGARLYKHKWLCGKGAGEAKQYRNWDDENGFYTTMAYITEKAGKDPQDGKWYDAGLVQGVQYQLTLYDNGMAELVDTLNGSSGVFDPSRKSNTPVLLPTAKEQISGFIPPVTYWLQSTDQATNPMPTSGTCDGGSGHGD